MLPFEKRKIAFVELGEQIETIIHRYENNSDESTDDFQNVLMIAKAENKWFTEENILFSLKSWANSLQSKNLFTWLEGYDISEHTIPYEVGIIMAGNIPLVGFHDFLSVLITGHKAVIKQSSNDKRLLPYIAKMLMSIEPEFQDYIHFEENTLKSYDAVIATGSNNTARYFEYYFKNKPHIIRKNRNGVAILNGNETIEDFKHLAEDIFKYFGLGCRNVSKLYVPKNYDFNDFYSHISHYKEFINHNKYANNYEYNKAVYLMSDIKFLDNGFLIVKEDTEISSPIAVVNFEEYEDKMLKTSLKLNSENIQCIVGNHNLCQFKFGEAQKPNLYDYADGVDTLNFLINLDTK